MFDSVLERGKRSQGRLGTGAAISLGLHLALVAVALWLSGRPAPKGNVEPMVTFFSARPAAAPPLGTPEARPSHSPERLPPKRPSRRAERLVHASEPLPTPAATEATPESTGAEAEGSGPVGVPEGSEGGTPGGTKGGTPGGEAGGAPGAGAEVLHFGEGMSRPVRLEGRLPQYTREALAARVEGVMLIRCVLTVEGTLEGCRVVKPLPHLEDEVLQAVRTWRFTPVRYQGQPVSVFYNIPVRMELPRR